MSIIKVVAAIIVQNHKVFATQRGYGDFKDGWEFPGGKIEAGETPEQALAREIREELNPDYLGLKENLSMIAVTGEKGTESSDANVKVLQALTAAGIEISTVNQGAGKLNLLIGVPEERYEDAIRAIYRTMQEG